MVAKVRLQRVRVLSKGKWKKYQRENPW
ncbi:uncharacterized protein G2W53_019297 [Senna tora]|uniref:Uncharacterized protein n=1 Tax=Senna tora TaxID=362788 RepID=A0A834TTC4_9FABA|nr:uncharacterized protein G2W53_019297 [Senna tora]